MTIIQTIAAVITGATSTYILAPISMHVSIRAILVGALTGAALWIIKALSRP